MKTESQVVVVCDECSELLTHQISSPGKSVEIRVGLCPECVTSAKSPRFSQEQLALIMKITWDALAPAKKFKGYSTDYNNLIAIRHKILKSRAK